MQHDHAYYLFKASLKLIASRQIAAYLAAQTPDPSLNKNLENLTQPSVGYWTEFLREVSRCLSHLDSADEASRAFSSALEEKRQDLPSLRAAITFFYKTCELPGAGPSRFSLLDFWNLLPSYRNKIIGHGAVRAESFYEEGFHALIAAVEELFTAADPFQGWALLYAESVQRDPAGQFRISWKDLRGPVTLPLLETPLVSSPEKVIPQRCYFSRQGVLFPLHPLVICQSDELISYYYCLFLNQKPLAAKLEYLCYDTGKTLSFRDQPEELSRLLHDLADLSSSSSTAPGRTRAKSMTWLDAISPSRKPPASCSRALKSWEAWAAAPWETSILPGSSPWTVLSPSSSSPEA